MENHKTCLLCHSEKLHNVKGYEHAYLCKCWDCGFVFAKKKPSDTELSIHYKKYPRNSPISAITLKRYDELLSEFEKYRLTNNILDVGCGDGHFLESAKKKGWNIYGTEYTDEAYSGCLSKGIQMHQGKLSATAFSVPFDVITSFEVLEHINNPLEEIQAIHALLRKNGLFYFTTPNFNSISKAVLGNKWPIIEYPEHLSYYTKRTIDCVLKKNGFVKEKFQSTGISLSKIIRVVETTNTHTLTNYDDKLRTSMEKSAFLSIIKHVINAALTLFRAGDTLKGYYKKTS